MSITMRSMLTSSMTSLKKSLCTKSAVKEADSELTVCRISASLSGPIASWAVKIFHCLENISLF